MADLSEFHNAEAGVVREAPPTAKFVFTPGKDVGSAEFVVEVGEEVEAVLANAQLGGRGFAVAHHQRFPVAGVGHDPLQLQRASQTFDHLVVQRRRLGAGEGVGAEVGLDHRVPPVAVDGEAGKPIPLAVEEAVGVSFSAAEAQGVALVEGARQPRLHPDKRDHRDQPDRR
jgi:hypothetical protein